MNTTLTQTRVPYKSELYDATIEAESALLGAILTVSATRKPIHEVSIILSPNDFIDDVNQTVFRAMLTTELPPNQIVIAHEVFKATGGKFCFSAEMCLMIAACPCCLDYQYYAQVVREYADCRNGFKRARFKGGV